MACEKLTKIIANAMRKYDYTRTWEPEKVVEEVADYLSLAFFKDAWRTAENMVLGKE